VRYGRHLVEAEFIARENRFAARVRVDGEEEMVHVPNSGRMRELLVPGADVLLLPSDSPGRRTGHDLVVVDNNGAMVSVDSRVPNAVVEESLADGSLPMASGYQEVVRERSWGSSRLDFHLRGERGEALVEVKGCTLVEDGGLALFPDAPTVRGTRHVRELVRALGTGMDAYVVVVVQRADGRVFSPNDRTDPAFGEALRDAARAGVEVMAYLTDVTREGVTLAEPIPVDLSGTLEAMT
jgi:sugar fermentation stimulation protein A